MTRSGLKDKQSKIALGVLWIAAVLLSMIGASPPASAAGNGLWSVAPAAIGQSNRAYFNFLVAPGSVIHDSVFVTNSTPSPQSFLLYPSDAVNTAAGSFSLQSPQASKKAVGEWTSLKTTQFTLAPHSVSDVPITITVPTSVTPGDYAGGVVLRPLFPTKEKRGSLTFGVFQSVGTRIYLRVKGPLHPSLQVTTISIHPETTIAGLFGGPTSANVTYTIKNTGNEILNPVAYLKVSPLAGSSVDFPKQPYPSLLPGNSVNFSGHVGSIEPFLKLSSQLTVDDRNPRAQTVVATASAWVIPWLAILVLVILIVGFIIWRRRRRDRSPHLEESDDGSASPATAHLVND